MENSNQLYLKLDIADIQFILDISPNYSYNFTVDWGDGTVEEKNISTGNKHLVHFYDTIGTKEIKISGIYPVLNLYGWNNVEILQWGTIQYHELNFQGIDNLIISATDSPDLYSVKQLKDTFNFTNFVSSPDLNKWDVSSIENFNGCFSGSNFNGDISNWNINGDISNMFSDTLKFDKNISGWTPAGNSIDCCFFNSEFFNQPIANWNTSKIEIMNNAFNGAKNFNQDISDWNISYLTNAKGMLDNSGFSTENYDLLLQKWSQQPTINNGVELGALGIKYSTSIQQFRDILTNTHNWNIIDDGSI